jgi:hypothetical protein
MPTYTLRRVSTGEEWDINCSFHDLAPILEDDDVIKVLSTPKIVTGVGSLQSKVPDGFKDKLNQIKKGSGKNNTIKT